MTGLQTIKPQSSAITPADAERITISWPLLLRSPLVNKAERDAVAAKVDALTQPMERAALMGRIASLLSTYYISDVSEGIRRLEAEDWAEALSGYPEWAVTKACRWWRSADNPNRRKKPLEGDIEARVKAEMGAVRIAELAVRRFDERRAPFDPETNQPRERCTPEAAKQILAKAQIGVKKFGGAA